MFVPHKSHVIIAVAGIAAGAVGYKLYQEHKDKILSSLDSLKNRIKKTEDKKAEDVAEATPAKK